MEALQSTPEAYRPPESLDQSFEYELLRGHNRTDGTYKSDEQLRLQYITLTDELIHKITDGVEVMNEESKKYEREIPEYVIFLDKSGRPVQWLVDELWDKLAPEPGSAEIPLKPAFRFLNIDRQQWVNTVDPEGKGEVDIGKVDESVIRSLRSIFVEPRYKKAGLTNDIDSAPASLDGKKVLIVDEVRSTGRTLDIAKRMVGAAFPTASIAGAYWMDGTVKVKGAKGNADLPIWYQERAEIGRGVGNRSDGVSRLSENATQRLGAWFLSTRFPVVDQRALQLRKEFHHLAQEPDVPIIASYLREDDEARTAALNHGNADEAYQRARIIKGIAK